MPYKKPTKWDWILLTPKLVYWRFFWEPPKHDRVQQNPVPSSDIYRIEK